MLRDNWPVIDWREPIGLQERLEGRSSHNGEISVMSRDSLKGNHTFIVCKMHADFDENGNNDHYKYNLMTCFIDIIYRLCR